MTARTLLAGLHLLDRQLVDRHDRLAGKVDDVELTVDDASGHLVVTALLSGRGALWDRLGASALAAWRRRPPPDRTPGADGGPGLAEGRIPVERVTHWGSTITIGAEVEELATFDGERWVRTHVSSHIPGSGHVAE
jgi:hypothetical protein